jgi:hypothetical protein
MFMHLPHHKKGEITMGNVLFAISAYILMRAFEVLFADRRDKTWYKLTIRIIACAVLYTAAASMVWFYFEGLHLLGFDPK